MKRWGNSLEIVLGLKQVSGTDYDELKAYAKKKKLKSKKEGDLVILIEYYNELLKQ